MRVVTINDGDHRVLLQNAKAITFPLDQHTQQIVTDIEQFLIELDQDHAISGMAAPQLGYSLRIIFYQLKKEWAKFGREVAEDIPFTPLFNPCYQPVLEDGMEKGFEGCFSVPDVVLEIYRYKTINYTWQDSDGRQYTRVARDFQARLLQHEIDHLNGILHSSLMRDDCRELTREEFMVLRAKIQAKAEEL